MANLASITNEGGLYSDNGRLIRSCQCVGIAHDHIKQRRANRNVPIANFGTLAHYVPFYFAPRSPMLFAAHRNAVQGYSDGQRPIVHLVTTAEAVAEIGLPFAFTDGHAEMAVSQFFDDLVKLGEIDWGIMRSKFWNDTQDQPDRKRKRQAEFLVHDFVPWTLVQRIGVLDQDIKSEVERILATVPHKPPVTVSPGWYY